MGENRSFIQALSEVRTTAQDELGTIRKEGNKWYKYIQYEQGAAAVDGVKNEMCYYDSTQGYQNSLVTSDLSDSDNMTAGQLLNNMAQGEFGWILIKGLSEVLPVDAVSTVAGRAMTATGATDGTLDLSASPIDHVAGWMVETTASLQVMCLNCPI